LSLTKMLELGFSTFSVLSLKELAYKHRDNLPNNPNLITWTAE